MPVTILSNKKNLSTTIHVTNANSGNIIVSGNSITTNVGGTSTCIAVSNEVLSGVVINQAIWGADSNSHIHVVRGANNVLVFNNSGHIDFAGAGLAVTKDSAANLVVNFIGTANSYIILELQKVGTFTSEYLQR